MDHYSITLVGTREQRGRHSKAEGFRRLEIDRELQLPPRLLLTLPTANRKEQRCREYRIIEDIAMPIFSPRLLACGQVR